MGVIICSGCNQEFECDSYGDSPEFDMHDCPSVPKIKQGESLEDYARRLANECT